MKRIGKRYNTQIIYTICIVGIVIEVLVVGAELLDKLQVSLPVFATLYSNSYGIDKAINMLRLAMIVAVMIVAQCKGKVYRIGRALIAVVILRVFVFGFVVHSIVASRLQVHQLPSTTHISGNSALWDYISGMVYTTLFILAVFFAIKGIIVGKGKVRGIFAIYLVASVAFMGLAYLIKILNLPWSAIYYTPVVYKGVLAVLYIIGYCMAISMLRAHAKDRQIEIE